MELRQSISILKLIIYLFIFFVSVFQGFGELYAGIGKEHPKVVSALLQCIPRELEANSNSPAKPLAKKKSTSDDANKKPTEDIPPKESKPKESPQIYEEELVVINAIQSLAKLGDHSELVIPALAQLLQTSNNSSNTMGIKYSSKIKEVLLDSLCSLLYRPESNSSSEDSKKSKRKSKDANGKSAKDYNANRAKVVESIVQLLVQQNSESLVRKKAAR